MQHAKTTFLSVLFGSIIASTFFLLIGGLYGGILAWGIVGAISAYSCSIYKKYWQRWIAASVTGSVTAVAILLFAYVRGEADGSLLLQGLIIWAITGAFIGYIIALAVNFMLSQLKTHSKM